MTLRDPSNVKLRLLQPVHINADRESVDGLSAAGFLDIYAWSGSGLRMTVSVATDGTAGSCRTVVC